MRDSGWDGIVLCEPWKTAGFWGSKMRLEQDVSVIAYIVLKTNRHLAFLSVVAFFFPPACQSLVYIRQLNLRLFIVSTQLENEPTGSRVLRPFRAWT